MAVCHRRLADCGRDPRAGNGQQRTSKRNASVDELRELLCLCTRCRDRRYTFPRLRAGSALRRTSPWALGDYNSLAYQRRGDGLLLSHRWQRGFRISTARRRPTWAEDFRPILRHGGRYGITYHRLHRHHHLDGQLRRICRRLGGSDRYRHRLLGVNRASDLWRQPSGLQVLVGRSRSRRYWGRSSHRHLLWRRESLSICLAFPEPGGGRSGTYLHLRASRQKRGLVLLSADDHLMGWIRSVWCTPGARIHARCLRHALASQPWCRKR